MKAYTQTPTVDVRLVDLFAGIGGFRLAFESLGAKCVFSSEWDKYSQDTYEANFGERPAGDITAIEAADIPPHDILTAGFPCQPFSLAGVTKANALGRSHGFEHKTQGTLFFDVCRIIKAHRPSAFVLENVRNLVSHDKGNTFRTILESLEDDLGYHVTARILNAQHLVPQHRQRIFIVGFRDPTDFQFPIMPDLRPRLGDILEDEVDERYTLTDNLWRYLQDYAAKHRAAGNGFGFGIADPEGVSRTLSARYGKDGSEILIAQEGRNPRRLTPRECARLMGYPEWFKIPVSDNRAYKQFGNSVVVPVVRLLAQEVLQWMIRQKPHRAEQLTLMAHPPRPKKQTPQSRLPLSESSSDDFANGEWNIREISPGGRLIASGTR